MTDRKLQKDFGAIGSTLNAARGAPCQQRARVTVDAILDAVTKVLKTHGVDGVTTNRIAEVAGVSIGSVYQYFPDKRAIFAALHERHVEQIGRIVEAKLVVHAASSLDDLMRALMEAMVEAPRSLTARLEHRASRPACVVHFGSRSRLGPAT